jgi:DNA-binding NarL/FixJ family response regulator
MEAASFPIRVLMVGDCPLMSRGIASVLESERAFLVVAEAADGVGNREVPGTTSGLHPDESPNAADE